jgi:hypothetical protein
VSSSSHLLGQLDEAMLPLREALRLARTHGGHRSPRRPSPSRHVTACPRESSETARPIDAAPERRPRLCRAGSTAGRYAPRAGGSIGTWLGTPETLRARVIRHAPGIEPTQPRGRPGAGVTRRLSCVTQVADQGFRGLRCAPLFVPPDPYRRPTRDAIRSVESTPTMDRMEPSAVLQESGC